MKLYRFISTIIGLGILATIMLAVMGFGANAFGPLGMILFPLFFIMIFHRPLGALATMGGRS